nr:uncharacterized protein LOC123771169 [Procambarus clarkii]
MGKPLQFSDSLHEQGQSEFASTNQEKIRVPGFVPVTSIWNHHLQFVPENSQVPVESVNRSMALHFRGKPLNFVTEEKKNKTNISPIGGIGNPGLRGVPVSLGNFNSYRVPSENMTITSDSINGGGEVDVRQQYPFKVRGSFNTSSSNSQKFVSTKNQTRSQYPAVSHMPQSSSAFEGIKMWNYASDDVADASPSLQPPKTINQLPHVMQQSITADPNEQDYFSLLTSSPVPSDSLFPSTFGSRPLYSETQSSSPSPTPLSFPTDPSYSPIQLLQQYYQYFEDSDQSNFYEEEYPLNDSLTPEGSLENMPNYFGDAAYVPAFDSPQSPAETSASSPRVPLPPAPPSSDLVLSSAPTTSASGCLATTLCSLVVAAALAIGATSAVAIPFLGRRRRNVDHIILSQDNAHEFVNYINYIKTGTLNNPGSENFFRALHDPADNSTRKIFRKLEQFIIRNKDKLLNISIQEIQLNEHIPIPKDILESINKINVESVNDPGKTDRGESEEDHTRTGDTAYSPGDMSPLLPDGIHASAMSSKLSDAKEELEDSNSQYGHDTEYNIILQHEEHSADVDARPFTGNYHTSYYNPFYGRPGSTVVGPNGRPYASNYLHPLQPVNTQRSQGTPVLRHPPRDRYPSRKPGYPYPPAHKHGSLDADIRLVAQGEGTGGHGGSPWRDRAGFYRTVCGALHHTHTPHNEITKFIASKCNILQNAGVI